MTTGEHTGSRGPRPKLPGASADRPSVDAMIRVDHAGEFGALQIYKGQLAVFGRGESESIRAIQRGSARSRC